MLFHVIKYFVAKVVEPDSEQKCFLLVIACEEVYCSRMFCWKSH